MMLVVLLFVRTFVRFVRIVLIIYSTFVVQCNNTKAEFKEKYL